jgi:amino acid transporter
MCLFLGYLEVFFGWILVVVVFGAIGLFCLYVNRAASFRGHNNFKPDSVEDSPSEVTPSPRPTATELLSSLPCIYYGLAIFYGVVLLVFTAANSDELSSTQIGAWIGYTVGAVLSMFAVGRVIELLEQIRNAVRNIPALSPSRPDDE